jgi:putative oxidoreductase
MALKPAASGNEGLNSAGMSDMAISVQRESLDEPLVRSSRIPDIALALLRIVAGLMFMQHGAQKLLGWLLPPDRPFSGAPEFLSQMWIAGTLELVGGFLIVIGLLTRLVGIVLAGEMSVAYFLVHLPQGFWPILNGGELAVLYCFIFLAFAALGGGPYSVDGLISRSRGHPIERPYSTSRWRRRKQIFEAEHEPSTRL